MKILLVNPAIRPDSPKCILNVGLGYVASALDRAGFDLEILDIDAHRYDHATVARLLRTKTYDAVGIGTLVSQYGWARSVMAEARAAKPNVPIVVGNTLATSVPEILVERTEADVAVIGEGDITAVEVFTALSDGRSLDEVQGIVYRQDGKTVRTMPRPVIKDVDGIPSPNYELFDLDIYLDKSRWMVPAPENLDIDFDTIRSMPVNTARGCPFSCTFCYHAFQNLKYRHRSPENVADEIQLWRDRYGVNFIAFWDELSFYQDKATERFAELMIQRNMGIQFFGSCRSELFKDETAHIAHKLKQAGCKGLGFALESGNEEILLAMNKHNHVSDFVRQCRILHDVGIEVYTSIVIGYPQETRETIAETFRVLADAYVYPSVGYLQPMPGTPMHKLALETGAIRDEEEYLLMMGDRQDLRVTLSEHMTGDEMEQAVHEELVALNNDLKTGLPEDGLIKTRAYRVSKEETFLDSFGIAGKVKQAA